jgi:hypothetical protein
MVGFVCLLDEMLFVVCLVCALMMVAHFGWCVDALFVVGESSGYYPHHSLLLSLNKPIHTSHLGVNDDLMIWSQGRS